MVEVQSNDSKRPIIPSSLMLSPIFSVNIPRDPQPEIFRNSSAKARYVTCSDLQHRVLACPGYCSHGFYAENWGDSNDISIGVNPGWCFGTWLGFDDSPIILGMECHHPKWRTPSFFRGVGTPPTRTQWAISNWGFWHWVYRHFPSLGWWKRTPALFWMVISSCGHPFLDFTQRKLVIEQEQSSCMCCCVYIWLPWQINLGATDHWILILDMIRYY